MHRKELGELARGERPATTEPLLRIWVLGPLALEWAEGTFPPERMHGRGSARALGVLKALLSQADRFATRDWLMEQFWPDSAISSAQERLDDVASGLRTLLRPPGSSANFLHYVHGSDGKGSGYRLEGYPRLWVDADAFGWLVEQAARLDRFGQDSLPLWEQAYHLGARGPFLPEERYSDWAQPRRELLAGHFRQCVHRLSALLRERGAYEQAFLRLRSYWQTHPTDEDALRPLMELLGAQERYQEAEAYYQQLLSALREEDHDQVPDSRTQDLREFLRTKELRRGRVEGSTTNSAMQLATGEKRRDSPDAFTSPSAPILLPGQQHDLSPDFSHAAIQDIIKATYESERTTQKSGPQDMEPSRRNLLQALSILGAELFVSPAVFRITDHAFLTVSNSPVHDDVLDQYEKLTNLCWQLLKGNELAAVEAILSLYFPHIVALAQQPSSQQHRMAYYAAHAFNIACLLAGHKDDLHIRLLRSQYSEQYSQLAQDRNLEVAALIQQCVTFDYWKQHDKSTQIYQKALRYSNDVSPLLRARIYAGLAGSYARTGQQEKKARQYLSLAQEIMPTKPEADPTFLYADCGHFTLPLWQGRMYLELDQLEEAWDVFSLAQRQQEIPVRISTEFLNHLLETSIFQGDRDKSLICLENALNAARDLKSERRLREIREAYERMRLLWRHEQQVKDAMDLFQQAKYEEEPGRL